MLLWLLMLLIPVQGMSAVWLQLQGPAHAHAPEAVTGLALALLVTQPLDDNEPLAPSHTHSHEGGQRHHHAAGDASVLIAADDMVSDLALDDGTRAVAATALFLPLIASHTVWGACEAVTPRVPSSQWTPSNRPPERLERPPRADAVT